MSKKRINRVNGRGEVWCYDCERHLPRYEFRLYPGHETRLWSYCKACTRVRDQRKYWKKMMNPVSADREMTRRIEQKRQHRRREFAERREYLATAIRRLLERDLTLADIEVVTGINRATLAIYRDGGASRKPTVNVAKRIGVLDEATLDWPRGKPAYKRRTSHPQREHLRESLHFQMARYPVRNAWINGRKPRREECAA